MDKKIKEIKQYLKQYRHLPRQGTAEWVAGRQFTIGGSELDAVLKDEARIVAQKAALTRGMGDNIFSCNWGSMFESTLRMITKIAFKTPIFEASSIPSCDVADKTYSMDGIGVVRFLCDEINGLKYDYFMHLITLFEYKCTLTREIHHGEVHAPYIPQVLSGMSDLGIPDIALYIEGVFRISRFEDLGYNRHVEDWLHASTRPNNWLFGSGNPHRQLPMCYGFIGFYMEDAVLPADPESDIILDWIRHGNMDFAKIESQSALNRLFKWVRAGVIKTRNSAVAFSAKEWRRCSWFTDHQMPVDDYHVDMDDEALAFHRWTADQNYICLGILGYKLLDANVVTVEKVPGYTQQFAPRIAAAVEKVRRLMTFEDPGERQLEYNRMYAIEDTSELAGGDDLADII